jgi:hypothetical protein
MTQAFRKEMAVPKHARCIDASFEQLESAVDVSVKIFEDIRPIKRQCPRTRGTLARARKSVEQVRPSFGRVAPPPQAPEHGTEPQVRLGVTRVCPAVLDRGSKILVV